MNEDGTYFVRYDDGDSEQHVPRFRIKRDGEKELAICTTTGLYIQKSVKTGTDIVKYEQAILLSDTGYYNVRDVTVLDINFDGAFDFAIVTGLGERNKVFLGDPRDVNGDNIAIASKGGLKHWDLAASPGKIFLKAKCV